jgi:hypothetical protein
MTLIVFDSYKWKPHPSNPSSFIPIPPLCLLPPAQPHSLHQPAHGARVGAAPPLIAAPSLSLPPPPAHGVVQGRCHPSCPCRAGLHPLRVRQIHTSHLQIHHSSATQTEAEASSPSSPIYTTEPPSPGHWPATSKAAASSGGGEPVGRPRIPRQGGPVRRIHLLLVL